MPLQIKSQALEEGCSWGDTLGLHTQVLLTKEADLSTPHPASSPGRLLLPAPTFVLHGCSCDSTANWLRGLIQLETNPAGKVPLAFRQMSFLIQFTVWPHKCLSQYKKGQDTGTDSQEGRQVGFPSSVVLPLFFGQKCLSHFSMRTTNMLVK